jgi:hypothetical protein
LHLHQILHHNGENGSWCKFMGSITARKGADGSVSYRAAIRINKKVILLILKAKHFIQKKWQKTGLKKRS